MDFFYMFLVVAVILASIFFTLFMPDKHHQESLIEARNKTQIIKIETMEQRKRVGIKHSNTMRAEKLR